MIINFPNCNKNQLYPKDIFIAYDAAKVEKVRSLCPISNVDGIDIDFPSDPISQSKSVSIAVAPNTQTL